MSEILIFNDCNGPLGFSRYAGPYRIATELRLNGFEVQLIEFFGDMVPDEVIQVINKHVDNTTLWVGMASTLFGKHLTYEQDLELWLTPPMGGLKQLNQVFQTLFPHTDEEMQLFIDRIKTINPNTKLVVGGYKSLHKEFPGIDYWVLGQGEGPAVAISKHLKYNEPLTYIETELGRVITDKMYEFKDFSSCKIIWDKSDHITWGEDLQIETARGCIFKCAFCAFNLNGKKFGDFTKHPQALREEMIYNYENFGTVGYMVADDTVNDSIQKVEFLHEVMTSLPFKPRLSCHLRLDIIARQPRMITLLHEMGVSSANFGIETFNQKAGKAIGKGADPELLKETLFKLQDAWGDDVFTSANFMVGLPHETRESIQQTFDWLHRPDLPLHGVSVNRLYISQLYPAVNPPWYTDEQMRGWGFIKGKRGWQYNNVSQMEADAGKYNMEYGEDKFFMWKNDEWSAKDCDIIVDKFYADTRNLDKKFSLTMFLNYNRMMNLGYTRDEIKSLYQNNPNTVIEAINRRRKLKTEYLIKVLK
jgi:hypothetical protein